MFAVALFLGLFLFGGQLLGIEMSLKLHLMLFAMFLSGTVLGYRAARS